MSSTQHCAWHTEGTELVAAVMVVVVTVLC